jgi:hypothetical protein
VRKVADARRKSEAQQMTQTEDVVGEAGRVGVVLLNPEIRLVIEQTIKNVCRFSFTCRKRAWRRTFIPLPVEIFL